MMKERFMRKRIAALLATFALAFCLPICTPAAFAASAFDQGGSSMAAAGIESDVTYNCLLYTSDAADE